MRYLSAGFFSSYDPRLRHRKHERFEVTEMYSVIMVGYEHDLVIGPGVYNTGYVEKVKQKLGPWSMFWPPSISAEGHMSYEAERRIDRLL